MLIGREVRTDHSGFIDLLALNADARLIVIELERDLTPREVVAQGLDYASRVRELTPDPHTSSYDNSLTEARSTPLCGNLGGISSPGPLSLYRNARGKPLSVRLM